MRRDCGGLHLGLVRLNAVVDPSVAAALAAIDAELLERRGAELKANLYEFVQHFWRVIEPSKPFKANWHIEVICLHLEAVSRGSIKNLLINVPPGTSKSTIVSVMWPAWELASDKSLRYFGASYSEPLAIRDAMLCRAILLDEEYQAMFPEGPRIKKGADQKTNYEFEGGGWRMATSVGGRGTGMHPNRKIVDDPHNVKQSESDVQRQEALDWFDGTVSSRGVIHDAPTVVIMQRLHAIDLTGHIMRSGDYSTWCHIVIPMEYEADRVYPKTPLGFKDPRRKSGELLWPDVFTKAKVQNLKVKLGEYRAAGQLQQRPAPAGGGIIKVKHFQLWPNNKVLPDIHYIIQSYDTAFKEGEENDPSGCEVWGMFYVGEVRNWLLLDAWDEKLSFPDLKTRMMDDWKAKYGGVKGDPAHPSRKPDLLLVEDKASGQSILQELRRANLPCKAYNPGNASKTERAHTASPVIEAGVLWVIESRIEPGKPISWARPVLQQCEDFPNGEHDEYVDTLTQFCIYVSHADLVTLPYVEADPVEEVDYVARKRSKRNPYG